MKKHHARISKITPPNVAKNAQPRHAKPTKAEKRLKIRIADYEKMMFGSKASPGTFHKPGSLQS